MNLLLNKYFMNYQKRKYREFGNNSLIHWWNSIIHFKKNINIGDYVYIGPRAEIYGFGGISIGDGTIIAPNVEIHSTNHNFHSLDTIPYGPEIKVKPVCIGKAVWIGSSVKIAPGSNIGEGSIIAMGSVVHGTIPPFCIAGGNPCKTIKKRNQHALSNLIRSEAYFLRAKKNGLALPRSIID